jgi:phosphatidylinositol-4,5-bisphosphate 3-kinase
VRENAQDALSAVLKTVKSRNLLKDSSALDDFILKARGLECYLYGTEPLIDYHFVRESLNRGQNIEFSLINKNDVSTDNHKDKVLGNLHSFKSLIRSPEKQKTWEEISSTDKLYCRLEDAKDEPFSVLIQEANLKDPDFFPILRCIEPDSLKKVSVKSFLLHGTDILSGSETNSRDFFSDPVWNESLFFSSNSGKRSISRVPREARLCFVLLVEHEQEGIYFQEPIAWTFLYIVNTLGMIRHGVQTLPLYVLPQSIPKIKAKAADGKEENADFDWEFLKYTIEGTACSKFQSYVSNELRLKVTLMEKFQKIIVLPPRSTEIESLKMSKSKNPPNPDKIGREILWEKLPVDMREIVESIVFRSHIQPLDKFQKQCIWVSRHYLVQFEEALAKFLQSVDWSDSDFRHEAYQFLEKWEKPTSSVSVLELLGAEFADTSIRNYAVECLHNISDFELKDLMPQLIQALKYEPSHFSALGDLLLHRAVANPVIIGNDLFWYLKFEMQRPMFGERYALLMEALLCLSGRFGYGYAKQYTIVSQLEKISESVAKFSRSGKPKKEILEVYRQQIKSLNERMTNHYGAWRNPLNPTMLLGTFVVPECRYMSSKMAPLWLTVQNVDNLAENLSM